MKQSYQRSLDEIERIVDDTRQFFEQHCINPDLRTAVDLCVEELFVNMVRYNIETKQQIELSMRPHEGGVEVTLRDFDVERFDPTRPRPVDVESPAEQREPGGLGLYLVLKMVDSIDYAYAQRTSRITFMITTAGRHV